ncbi:unnamed protein product [Rotaria sp. Silwood2]|nr:unnamed protein product [Rotaria sp. Silwood2]CAF4107151.1 unnamed protein product [Rotaria sp. Silwood2]
MGLGMLWGNFYYVYMARKLAFKEQRGDIFIGLLICADTLAIISRRHYPAFLLGLMPVVADWAHSTIVASVSAGYSNFTVANVRFSPNVTSMISTFSYQGLVNFSGGSLLLCIVMTAILIYAIDRKFIRAAVWSVIAAVLSLFGVIHASSVGLLIKPTDDGWRFTVAYSMMTVIFGIFHLAQRKNWIKAAAEESNDLSRSV